MKEIFAYRFNEDPNYEKLRFILLQVLLDNEEMADNKFDWNANHAITDEADLELPVDDTAF